jgi:adenylate cyclase
MMEMLARSNRKGELQRRMVELPEERFAALLDEVTREAEQFLRVTELSQDDAFQSMLAEALAAFTFRFGELVQVERASLFLVDAPRGELWLKVAQEEGGQPVDVRVPITRGIAGEVARTGRALRVDDAYAHPAFNPDVDRQTGFRTRSVLCVPVEDRAGRVFAVAQLLNKRSGAPFDDEDEERLREFTRRVAVVLESWERMSLRRSGG